MHTSELYRKKKKKELYKKHVCKLKKWHISVYFWTKIYHNTREERVNCCCQNSSQIWTFSGVWKDYTKVALFSFIFMHHGTPWLQPETQIPYSMRENLFHCYCISALMRNRKYQQSHENACFLKISSSN